jgi:hypothetical protein
MMQVVNLHRLGRSNERSEARYTSAKSVVARSPSDRRSECAAMMLGSLLGAVAAFERTLMQKILSCAKDLGFTHLAVEALQEDDSAFEARGYASLSQSGVYTRAPGCACTVSEVAVVWSDTAQLTSAQGTLAAGMPATVTMN